MMTQLKVKLLNKDAKVPTYGSEMAGAFDLYATEDAVLMPIKVDSDLHHMGGFDAQQETSIARLVREEWDGYFAQGYSALRRTTINLWEALNEAGDIDYFNTFVFQVFFRANDEDKNPVDFLLFQANKDDFQFHTPFISNNGVEFYVSVRIPNLEDALEDVGSDIELDGFINEDGHLFVNSKDILAYHLDDFYSIKYGAYDSKVVGTGIALQLEPDEVLNIRPRSGLWFKHGVSVFGGTIDADYRGGIKISMYNTSAEPFHVEKGMRIAQGVITKFEKKEMVVVDELDDTARGEGGFASTGLK